MNQTKKETKQAQMLWDVLLVNSLQDFIAAITPAERHLLMSYPSRKEPSAVLSVLILGVDHQQTQKLLLEELARVEKQRHFTHLTALATTAIFATDLLICLPDSLDWISFLALFLLACNACYVQGIYAGLSQISDNDM
ncbi:MAG TPA: hypothetical protein V6D25_30955 [Leptolyngbyaceae cyanobacterium]